jgi:hypothetical protein
MSKLLYVMLYGKENAKCDDDSSGTLRRIELQKFTDVSEVLTISIIRAY